MNSSINNSSSSTPSMIIRDMDGVARRKRVQVLPFLVNRPHAIDRRMDSL
jgi:hypothetical protein